MTEAELAEFKQQWIEYQRKHYPDPKELEAARRERKREQNRRYYAEHREQRREYQRRYREHYYTPLKSDAQGTERS